MRWWWPVVGLIPLLTVAVLASRGVFSPGTTTPPVGSGPEVTPTTVTSVGSAPTQTAPTPVFTAATTTTSAASATSNGGSPTPTTTSTQSSSTASSSSTTQAGETATSGGPFVAYRVKPGDTVRFIARMYGVSTASISQASGLTNPDLVRVGQVLTIPAQPGWLYRVQP